MSSRTLVVEAAFGFGPLDTLTSTDWVSLTRTDTWTTRAMRASWEYGRDSDLDPFPRGTASVTLWNRDRYLDPDYSGSPYAGDLLPRVPVRIRSQNVDTAAFRDEFYGFVEGGWEQILAPTGTTICRIQLVDMLGVIEGYELPDVFEHAVLSESPSGFWVLDRALGETVADQGSDRNDGTLNGPGVKLGDKVIAPGHPPAARFDNDADTIGHIDLGRSPVIKDVTTGMVMVSFLGTSVDQFGHVAFLQSDGNALQTGVFLGISLTNPGEVFWNRGLVGTEYKVFSTGINVLNRSVLAFGWANNLRVDATVFTDASTSVVDYGQSLLNGTSIGVGGQDQAQGWLGWIGAVATWADHSTVGDSGRAAIETGYSKLNGDRSDEQIGWALDRVGVPAGLRNLDTGTVFMGPAVTKGRDALSWIREVAATEQGELYIDHRDGGKVRFRHRYARYLEASGNTSQATFSDDPGGAGVIRYTADGLDLAPNGLDSIVNQMVVQWADGEVTVSDDASIAAYGPRPRNLQTAATTAGQARSTAEWVISRRKDPASRIRGCTASVRSCQFVDDTAQGLEIGDRVTFRVHPTGTATVPVGSATTVALHVEGARHEFEGVEWRTAFQFSSAPTLTPWIWGTSEWGETTTWG